MTETPATPPPPADDLELHGGVLLDGYGWLGSACAVIQTLALIVIAVALVAMV